MSRHRDKLRRYLLDVTQDLVLRGVVRRQQGQPLADVLRIECLTVLRELEGDLSAIGTELGVGLVKAVSNHVGSLFQSALERLLVAKR
jgi:hypothetical protein